MPNDFPYILGPCAVETYDEFRQCAETLTEAMGSRRWWLKASYRKANRTALGAPEGPGLDEFEEWVYDVRSAFPSIRLTTDCHTPEEAARLANILDRRFDIIQVPAFLSRQTDLLVECGRHFRTVHVKWMQAMSPRSACYIPEKVRAGGCAEEVWISDRGRQFGYETLLIDPGAVPELAQSFDRVLLDATHSTQRMDPLQTTKGSRELGERFFIAAPALGYGGVFAETHPDPANAISDSSMQIPLDRIATLVTRCEWVARAAKTEPVHE